MKNKKVLVLSNNCFSLSNSNGRTLGNLFEGWPKENLAQFCVIASDPNWSLCDNYYCLEDKNVLHAFLRLRKAIGRKLEQVQLSMNDTKRALVRKKSIKKVLLRELVWSNRRWCSNAFVKWIDDFKPNLIVFQFGDSMFMLDIAYYISKHRAIPLIIYNTEGYYFFNENWYNRGQLDNLFFKFYKKLYRKKVEKVMAETSHSFYLNDKLKKDYDEIFGNRSTVIYNSSSLVPCIAPFSSPSQVKFSYLGNLGIDRDSALIEVGEVLQGINPNYIIDVYGKADFDMQKRFAKVPGINYKGLVSYEDVKRVIEESDILFHVESENGYKERQLQYAFSTKIADSIASGKCFVLYAPKELACSEYISDTKAGWLATNKDELRDVIVSILENPKERQEVLSRARSVASQNHDYLANAQKFQDIILSI